MAYDIEDDILQCKTDRKIQTSLICKYVQKSFSSQLSVKGGRFQEVLCSDGPPLCSTCLHILIDWLISMLHVLCQGIYIETEKCKQNISKSLDSQDTYLKETIG